MNTWMRRCRPTHTSALCDDGGGTARSLASDVSVNASLPSATLPPPGCPHVGLQINSNNDKDSTHVHVRVFLGLGGSGLRRRRAWVQIAVAMLLGNSLRQTVHTCRASVHQAAKLVGALLRVARVTVGLAEGSLPPGL